MLFENKKIFVVATDTDAGKTFVSVKLLEMYKKSGLNPFYFKPIATGGIDIDGSLVSEDILKVKEKTKINADNEIMNPVIFKVPAAPIIAAQHENREVDLNLIFQTYDKINATYDSIVVEGIGGVLVPITKEIAVIDLIKKWRLPVVIVSPVFLGMINHTLLTINVLKQYNVEILGLIFSYRDVFLQPKTVTDSFKVIEEIGKVKILKVYDFDKDY